MSIALEPPTMSTENAVQAGERKEEIKRALYILIVWTTGVILAGILLVLLSDVFASLFV
ncbi:hypothetical protein SAMN05443661_12825 [Natronobacterium gregoryi]|uniref:Uncharacterized protein n=2 Tax=Natronobacterium gregoryi TaxID=44930 RepID=L0AJ57_NATGS|nr:hypothetical protein Natgr_2687 [Natronobacterium gregoryi SP2]SFJ42210.1 hypothetical protein SAMN05443661_12825 [Natronobacterium gregoryi]